MSNSKLLKGAVLIGLLILPFLIYFFFVYGSKETFFKTLDYVGEKTPVKRVNDRGKTVMDTMYYTIPSWSFTDQYDTTVTSHEMHGNIYLANFFFSTCPTICPAMNYQVQQIQNRFKGYENFKIVSFSVDPQYDTPEVLRKYAKKMSAIPGEWYFMTGKMDSIYKTANDFFLSAMVDSSAAGGFLHSQNLVLVDWDGHIRSRKDKYGNIKAVYNSANAQDISDLEDDIKVLIAEHEKKKSMDEYRASKHLKLKNRN